MTDWKVYARKEVIGWLLAEDNPAVRAQTLTALLDHSPDDLPVRQALEHELENGLSSRVFDKMQPGGWWGRPEDFYMRSKYHGTVWSFLLLAEMGCAFGDERFQAAAEFLLTHAWRPDNGGFTYSTPKPAGGARPAAVPCLTGNLNWAMTHAGLSYDGRLQKAAAWLAENQFLRDGRDDPSPAAVPPGMEKSLFENCWGQHTCLMGVIKALKALAVWPADNRTARMQQAVKDGADFVLKHRLVYRSHDPARIAKAEYFSFGFPLFWGTDALEMLEILLALNVRHEAFEPVLQIVLSKCGGDGRWQLERSWNGRMLVRIEKNAQPSKWITLRALRVLKLASEAGYDIQPQEI